jgi:hypothetical protein
MMGWGSQGQGATQELLHTLLACKAARRDAEGVQTPGWPGKTESLGRREKVFYEEAVSAIEAPTVVARLAKASARSPWHREKVRHIGEEMPSRRTAPCRESKQQGARVERRWLNGAIVSRQNVLRPRAEGATSTAYAQTGGPLCKAKKS